MHKPSSQDASQVNQALAQREQSRARSREQLEEARTTSQQKDLGFRDRFLGGSCIVRGRVVSTLRRGVKVLISCF